ncbi:hypothetical protein Pmani_025323 [Petrolisthes manimaculis]|uniref:Uncharacterized protein n=1 Tax=Petrolisthes manimaculis TaxID=1843537 RepID=A0AAE1P5S0_9EUCA|nr:hypothetical protein Pmani_025323 [Petrolisthes manimaculis]
MTATTTTTTTTITTLLVFLASLVSSQAESPRVVVTTTTQHPKVITNTDTTTTAYPRIITTQGEGNKSSIEVPEYQPVSSLLVWSDVPNTTVQLHVQSIYVYSRNFTLPETKMWHFINIYQPVNLPDDNRTAMIWVPSANIYTSLSYARVSNLTVTSDHLAHWIFCPNAYTCALVPPPPASTIIPTRSSRSEGGGGKLLAPLLVVSLLLVVALLALMALTCYRRKDIFHVYEEPFWPPQPPPLPYPVLQVETVEGNPERKLHREEVTTNSNTTTKSEHVSGPMSGQYISDVILPQPTNDVSNKELRCDWSRERDFTTIFPDQDSVNMSEISKGKRSCKDLPEFLPPPPPTTTTTTTTSSTTTPTPTTTVAVLTSLPAPFSTDRTSFIVVVVLGVVCGILALTTITFAVCFCRASRRMTASKVDQATATAPLLPPGPPPPPPSTAPSSWEHYYHYGSNQHCMRKSSEHSSENSLYEAFDGDALSMGHI